MSFRNAGRVFCYLRTETCLKVKKQKRNLGQNFLIFDWTGSCIFDWPVVVHLYHNKCDTGAISGQYTGAIREMFSLTDSDDSECSPSGPECCFWTSLGPVGGCGDRMQMMSSSYLLERSTFQTRPIILFQIKIYIFMIIIYKIIYFTKV